MKNFSWIPALLILFFLGDRAVGWLLGNITTESQFRYSRLYGGQAECDVLLVGNSRGLIFYQPYIEEKTGLSTVNLSYNGMPMDLAKALVEDHLDRYQPRQVILDISLLDKRMDDRLITGFNLYTPYSERLADLLKAKYPDSYWAGRVTHLYRYNSEVFQRALYYRNRSDEDWLLDRVISPGMQEEAVNLDTFNLDFTPEMIADLADLVRFANAKGVDVQLVVNPYFPPFAQKIGNLQELMAAVQAATGLEVHNYANAVQRTDGFGDYQHLNKNGAREFLDQLMADGVLFSAK